MAHAQFTKELAVEAAESLITQGKKPTIDNVRKLMGGGSPNDVTEWMREFRNQQQQIAIAKQVPVPEKIQDQAILQIKQLLDEAWDTARTVANEKLSKERQALNSEREEFENEISESLEQAESLYNENISIKEQLVKFEEQGKKNSIIIGDLNQEKRIFEEKIKEFHHQKQTGDKQLLELNKENKKTLANNAKKDGVIDELRKTNTGVTTQLKISEKEINKIQNNIETKKLIYEQTKNDLSRLNKELKTTDNENKTLNLQVQAQQLSLDMAVSSVDELKIEIKEARQTAIKAQKEVSKLSGQLIVTDKDNQKLEDKILELERMLGNFKSN